MVNTYPTKSEYERALETVKKYENRQADLDRLEGDLSFYLSRFKSFKFKINKKKGSVIFSGVLKEGSNEKVIIGESICQKNDKYNSTIGKLIAVKNALGEDIRDVLNHVESVEFTGGIVASSTLSVQQLHHLNKL